jgi:hypothetical protein
VRSGVETSEAQIIIDTTSIAPMTGGSSVIDTCHTVGDSGAPFP